MSIEKTIDEILKDAGKVKTPLDAKASVLVWVGFSLVVVISILVLLFSFRSDLSEVAGQFWFCFNLLALAGIFVSASYLGLVSAVPGKKLPMAATFSLQIALLSFFLSLFPSMLHMPLASILRIGINPLTGFKCSSALAILGLIPGLLLFLAIRNLAPIHPKRTAKMIGFAMGAMGAFGLGLDCMIQNPVHLIIYHGLPILLLGVLGTAIGNKVLHW